MEATVEKKATSSKFKSWKLRHWRIRDRRLIHYNSSCTDWKDCTASEIKLDLDLAHMASASFYPKSNPKPNILHIKHPKIGSNPNAQSEGFDANNGILLRFSADQRPGQDIMCAWLKVLTSWGVDRQKDRIYVAIPSNFSYALWILLCALYDHKDLLITEGLFRKESVTMRVKHELCNDMLYELVSVQDLKSQYSDIDLLAKSLQYILCVLPCSIFGDTNFEDLLKEMQTYELELIDDETAKTVSDEELDRDICDMSPELLVKFRDFIHEMYQVTEEGYAKGKYKHRYGLISLILHLLKRITMNGKINRQSCHSMARLFWMCFESKNYIQNLLNPNRSLLLIKVLIFHAYFLFPVKRYKMGDIVCAEKQEKITMDKYRELKMTKKQKQNSIKKMKRDPPTNYFDADMYINNMNEANTEPAPAPPPKDEEYYETIHMGNGVYEEKEEPKEENINEYTVIFTAKPFGINFGGTKDKRNLLVKRVNAGSVADVQKVTLGSVVLKMMDENVENKGTKNIYKLITDKYKDTLPLRITFRKPDIVYEEKDSAEPAPPPPPKDGEYYAAVDRGVYEPSNDEYTVIFEAKPFGLNFGSTKDKHNLSVKKVNADSVAEKQNVTVGSVVLKMMDENVENTGSKNIYKLITGKYKDTLPMRITFRRPEIAEKEEFKDEPKISAVYEEKEVPKEEPNDEYTVSFDSKPFGLNFGRTESKNNLSVNTVRLGSAADKQNVALHSKIIKIMDRNVENKGATNIYKMITDEYKDTLPLKITFRNDGDSKEEEKAAVLPTATYESKEETNILRRMESESNESPFQQRQKEKLQGLTQWESDEYTVIFEAKPFGINFGGTKDKRNLSVKKVTAGSAAAQKQVTVGSVVLKIMQEKVENKGAKNIYKLVTDKYKQTLPLRITFRKPESIISEEYKAEAKPERVHKKYESKDDLDIGAYLKKETEITQNLTQMEAEMNKNEKNHFEAIRSQYVSVGLMFNDGDSGSEIDLSNIAPQKTRMYRQRSLSQPNIVIPVVQSSSAAPMRNLSGWDVIAQAKICKFMKPCYSNNFYGEYMFFVHKNERKKAKKSQQSSESFKYDVISHNYQSFIREYPHDLLKKLHNFSCAIDVNGKRLFIVGSNYEFIELKHLHNDTNEGLFVWNESNVWRNKALGSNNIREYGADVECIFMDSPYVHELHIVGGAKNNCHFKWDETGQKMVKLYEFETFKNIIGHEMVYFQSEHHSEFKSKLLLLGGYINHNLNEPIDTIMYCDLFDEAKPQMTDESEMIDDALKVGRAFTMGSVAYAIEAINDDCVQCAQTETENTQFPHTIYLKEGQLKYVTFSSMETKADKKCDLEWKVFETALPIPIAYFGSIVYKNLFLITFGGRNIVTNRKGKREKTIRISSDIWYLNVTDMKWHKSKRKCPATQNKKGWHSVLTKENVIHLFEREGRRHFTMKMTDIISDKELTRAEESLQNVYGNGEEESDQEREGSDTPTPMPEDYAMESGGDKDERDAKEEKAEILYDTPIAGNNENESEIEIANMIDEEESEAIESERFSCKAYLGWFTALCGGSQAQPTTVSRVASNSDSIHSEQSVSDDDEI